MCLVPVPRGKRPEWQRPHQRNVHLRPETVHKTSAASQGRIRSVSASTCLASLQARGLRRWPSISGKGSKEVSQHVLCGILWHSACMALPIKGRSRLRLQQAQSFTDKTGSLRASCKSNVPMQMAKTAPLWIQLMQLLED